MTKITTRRDDTTKRNIAIAEINGKPVATVSGLAENVSELDVMKRLAICLIERLDAVLAAFDKRDEVSLPEGR